MTARLIASVGIITVLSTLGLARPAHAGPPLLCHPYEIGAAKSLPWEGHDWWPGRADYKVANLVADTQALLTPETPVIVRMETLRRATIYAMRDRNVATQLLGTIVKRAHVLEYAGRPDALACSSRLHHRGAARSCGPCPDVEEHAFRRRCPRGARVDRRRRRLRADSEEPRDAPRRPVDRVRGRVDRGARQWKRREFAKV